MAYATEAEFAAFLEPDSPPAHARRLIDTASDQVDELIRFAVYEVDAEDDPVSVKVAGALKKATIYQAHYLMTTGDETGANANVSSMSQGGLSIARSFGSGGSGRTPRYSENAVGVLRAQGLLPIRPRTR
jgi:glycerol-3-phosphate dehydrogenase